MRKGQCLQEWSRFTGKWCSCTLTCDGIIERMKRDVCWESHILHKKCPMVQTTHWWTTKKTSTIFGANEPGMMWTIANYQLSKIFNLLAWLMKFVFHSPGIIFTWNQFSQWFFSGQIKVGGLLSSEAPGSLGSEDFFSFWEGLLAGGMLVSGRV